MLEYEGIMAHNSITFIKIWQYGIQFKMINRGELVNTFILSALPSTSMNRVADVVHNIGTRSYSYAHGRGRGSRIRSSCTMNGILGTTSMELIEHGSLVSSPIVKESKSKNNNKNLNSSSTFIGKLGIKIGKSSKLLSFANNDNNNNNNDNNNDNNNGNEFASSYCNGNRCNSRGRNISISKNSHMVNGNGSSGRGSKSSKSEGGHHCHGSRAGRTSKESQQYSRRAVHNPKEMCKRYAKLYQILRHSSTCSLEYTLNYFTGKENVKAEQSGSDGAKQPARGLCLLPIVVCN